MLESKTSVAQEVGSYEHTCIHTYMHTCTRAIYIHTYMHTCIEHFTSSSLKPLLQSESQKQTLLITAVWVSETNTSHYCSLSLRNKRFSLLQSESQKQTLFITAVWVSKTDTSAHKINQKIHTWTENITCRLPTLLSHVSALNTSVPSAKSKSFPALFVTSCLSCGHRNLSSFGTMFVALPRHVRVRRDACYTHTQGHCAVCGNMYSYVCVYVNLIFLIVRMCVCVSSRQAFLLRAIHKNILLCCCVSSNGTMFVACWVRAPEMWCMLLLCLTNLGKGSV